MQILLRTIEKGQEFTINHDLNFQNEKYEARHPIVCHLSLLSDVLEMSMTRRADDTWHRSLKELRALFWKS